MKQNPLRELEKLGQAVWLDFIRRDLILGGELQRLIDEDGLQGMTSNPSIFEKAILESHDYDADIRALALQGKMPAAIFEALSLDDVRRAADVFRPVYERTSGQGGYVSLEVNPHLAHDTGATVIEARRLWAELDRPNVFIKVPATREGLPAIRQLIGEGINVNVTLLFGLPRYQDVTDAYLSGIEDRIERNLPVADIASVASFFVSRMDTLVDPQLEALTAHGGDKASLATELRGRVAVANSKAAYRIYREVFGSERFKRLAARGARMQRLLWASTSTKNPEYSDIKYVDELVGPDTINTMPVSTLEAYRDHGDPKPRIEQDATAAHWVLAQLSALGIDMERVTQQLEDEGDAKFCEPYDKLMDTLARTVADLAHSRQPAAAA
jgi:transaldolase